MSGLSLLIYLQTDCTYSPSCLQRGPRGSQSQQWAHLVFSAWGLPTLLHQEEPGLREEKTDSSLWEGYRRRLGANAFCVKKQEIFLESLVPWWKDTAQPNHSLNTNSWKYHWKSERHQEPLIYSGKSEITQLNKWMISSGNICVFQSTYLITQNTQLT